jgi:deoxyribose-phosphate aldolase
MTNSTIPLDIQFINSQRVNLSAVERRCDSLVKRRSLKNHHQAAWLLLAIELIDLTSLSGDDTPGRIRRLCAKAKDPINVELKRCLGVSKTLTVAAICVYYQMIQHAKFSLANCNVHLAAVSTGFPAGLVPFELKIAEIQAAIEAGADEIDIVISREHVLTGNWLALYDEVKSFKDTCKNVHLKAILGIGDLGTLRNVAKASWVCMMAGADFIKTSTGKEDKNASLPVSLVMCRAIRDYYELTGSRVGYKPAGGISKTKEALQYLILVKEELGNEWLNNNLFRFGASSLLGDIERQLDHFVSGAYSSANRHPLV